MSIRDLVLPLEAFDWLGKPEAESLFASAWNTQGTELINSLHLLSDRLGAEDARETRAYLSMEVVAIAIEAVELMAHVLLPIANPNVSSFLDVPPSDLENFFRTFAHRSMSRTAIWRFLGIPDGLDLASEVSKAMGSIETRAKTLIRHACQFWTSNVHDVRWFRHLPASLKRDDLDLIKVEETPSLKRAIRIADAHAKSIVEIRLEPEGDVMNWRPISEERWKIGRGISNVVLQLVQTRASNLFLDSASADPEFRLPKLYPVLTKKLRSREMKAIKESGRFFLVPDA